MLISYNIRISIINLIDDSIIKLTKGFEYDLSLPDNLLYDNYHIISSETYILDLFQKEVSDYCLLHGIESSSIEIDEYELESLTDRVELFFVNPQDETIFTLSPSIKCYVYPKLEQLKVPTLIGEAYDSTTIIWTWPEDENYGHYLVNEPVDVSIADSNHIIAKLPADVTSYIETNLEPNTAYSRRLVNYTESQISQLSRETIVRTECVKQAVNLEQYNIEREEDFTLKKEESEIIENRLTAFHSGVGNGNDLKIYKQMDTEIYESFKSYLELTGAYYQKEKRYEQVGFNYKLYLEATETVEEQEGEVTFMIDCYPKQKITISQYLFAVHPLTVKTKLEAFVTLKKQGSETVTQKIGVKKENYTPTTTSVEVPCFNSDRSIFVFSIDVSGSMNWKEGGIYKTSSGKNYMEVVIPSIKDTLTAIKMTLMDYKQQAMNMPSPDESTKFEALISFSLFSTNAIMYPNNTTPKTYLLSADVENNTRYRKENESDENYKTYLRSTSQLKTIFAILDSLYTETGNNSSNRWVFNSKYCYTDPNIKNTMNTPSKVNRYYTNWQIGINNAYHLGNKIKANNPDCTAYHLFFSDGIPNAYPTYNSDKTISGYKFCGEKNSTMYTKITNEAKRLRDVYENVFVVTLIKNELPDNIKECIKNMTGSNQNTNSAITASERDTSITNAFFTALKKCQTTKTIEVIDEKGDTEITKEYINITKTIDVNDMIIVKFETDPIAFTFDESVTPVYYNEKEQRAKIAFSMQPRLLSTTNVQDLMMEKINSLPQISQGYEVVTDSNGNPLISNLVIYDNYAYGDEDEYIEEENYYDFALRGSINVFANKIGNVESEDYGDDYYIVSKDTMLMISGYTDAIIYEGKRFNTAEINAKNKPSATIFESGTNARVLLRNRKNPNFIYPGDMNKVFTLSDVIEQDEYINLIGNGLTTDMVATTTAHFKSPILNYRFNLEDPDAYTPYYEILPQSNPDSINKNYIDLTIYQAQNVYINDEYITNFNVLNDRGDYTGVNGTPIIRLYSDELIDNYIHFMAKPMTKTQPYYDELPGEGLDVFYGLVNGRYKKDNKSGKQNLKVVAPSFNIPATVLDRHADSIKIYVKITKFYPDTALVSYQWEHEIKDGYTSTNGDTLIFSCDSVTYKDVEYKNIIGTYNMDEMELVDTTIKEVIFNINKPIDASNKYDHYYLRVLTDNSDVLATKYPSEIVFDQDRAVIPVTFKGIVNATSRWSPRIHNGFYYLNQHENYLYSEFNVKANFDEHTEVEYADMDLFISIQVSMSRNENINETYTILKDTANELLQDEEKFCWIKGKGLTLLPVISGYKYKHYEACEYISPVIMFPYQLTNILQSLNVTYQSNDTLTFYGRYYDLESGVWSPWEPLWGGASATPLSSGYQIKVELKATESHSEYEENNYLCCYIDWKNDMQETACTNINIVTDYITTETDNIDGIFISKIIDYGCETGMKLNLYASNLKNNVEGYIAFSNNPKDLIAEAAKWIPFNESSLELKYRYYRYKIVIPSNEKVYWLQKSFRTLQSEITLPYITGISMKGCYTSEDIKDSFLNVESFKIKRDGKEYIVMNSLKEYIEEDVIALGFELSDITKIDIKSNLKDTDLIYDQGLNEENPNIDLLGNPISAKADIETVSSTTIYPYIFVEETNKVYITGTPKQYCPISIEDENGNTYLQLFDEDISLDNLKHTDSFKITQVNRFLELKYSTIDLDTITVTINDIETTDFEVINNLIIFPNYFAIGDIVTISYNILHSFYATINHKENTTELSLYTGTNLAMPQKVKVKFETNEKNNKLRLDHLSLNPIYRSDYKGFIYLTDDINVPKKLNIYCNPRRIKAGGFDKVDVIIELLDELNNPVVNRLISIDLYAQANGENVNAGAIETIKEFKTDINGIVHIVYVSALASCTATIKATYIREGYTDLTNEIEIINY